MDEKYTLADDSVVRVETKATGLLAKLAHDLSIVARPTMSTSFAKDEVVVTVQVAPSQLRVDGVRKGDVVDRSILSNQDRADIENKMRREVLVSRDVVAEVRLQRADLASLGQSTPTVQVSLTIHDRTLTFPCRIELQADDKRLLVKATWVVAMSKYGLQPVKGPLNAFRVSDQVEVHVNLTVLRQQAAN